MGHSGSWASVISSLLSAQPRIAAFDAQRSGTREYIREAACRSIDDRRSNRPALTTPWRPGLRIVQIERLSPISLLVSWSDSTQCCYRDQTWDAVSARKNGYCALTGNVIRRGDAVFKPRCRGRNRPVNCEEMILAREVLRVKPAT